jgi:riboflavin kinase/FMN adenylyltransferase
MAIVAAWSPEEWVERLGPERGRSVVTIGNFDGVHLGHQEILRRVEAHAHLSKSTPAVLTFYPHPSQILRPTQASTLLETIDQRVQRLGDAGMDAVWVARFSGEMAALSPEEFAESFLARTMRARIVLVGEAFRFGHKQAGDVQTLRDLGARLDFALETVPPVYVDFSAAQDAPAGATRRCVISSSAIRSAVREGRMEDAAQMLGRPFALAGEIRTGTGLGRKLVVPTLNLSTAQETLPKMGVYATETNVDGRDYMSVTNVGMRPTFDGAKLAIETHLLGFNENLTTGAMTIRFRTRIRDENKFSGAEELKQQILRDIETAKEYFGTTRTR